MALSANFADSKISVDPHPSTKTQPQMSHANSVRLVTEVQAKNSERFLYITFYATHCWEQKLQPPFNVLRWCLLHFCGEVSCTGVCTFLHLHHFISILFAIFFVCVVHFLGTRRSSDFCSAADSTPLSVYPGLPSSLPSLHF